MNFNAIPKRTYTPYKTPIEELKNLRKKIGTPSPKLFIKRDDQLGLAAGGNKTRKLEYLMADALNQGANTIITCGAIQSNHCRLTLSASKKEGLDCYLLLEERVPNTFKQNASGNNFLYYLMGATEINVYPKGSNLLNEMQVLANKLKAKGKKPYIIPGGGSNSIGALGYVSCMLELMKQCKEQSIQLNHIVCTSGSSGTHAGLLVGRQLLGLSIPIIGISVMRSQADQINTVYQLVEATCKTLNISAPPKSDVIVYDTFIGDGYALPSKGMIDASKTLARTEGILLDPVYTGKAFDGFLSLLRSKVFGSDESVLFLHTGGSPALYAYEDIFKDDQTILNSYLNQS